MIQPDECAVTFLGLNAYGFDAMWVYLSALDQSLQQNPTLLDGLSIDVTYQNDTIASRIYENMRNLSIFGASVRVKYIKP